MHELGEDMNEKELEDMIAEADHDGDGEIDYNEFTSMMRARKRRESLVRRKSVRLGLSCAVQYKVYVDSKEHQKTVKKIMADAFTKGQKTFVTEFMAQMAVWDTKHHTQGKKKQQREKQDKETATTTTTDSVKFVERKLAIVGSVLHVHSDSYVIDDVNNETVYTTNPETDSIQIITRTLVPTIDPNSVLHDMFNQVKTRKKSQWEQSVDASSRALIVHMGWRDDHTKEHTTTPTAPTAGTAAARAKRTKRSSFFTYTIDGSGGVLGRGGSGGSGGSGGVGGTGGTGGSGEVKTNAVAGLFPLRTHTQTPHAIISKRILPLHTNEMNEFTETKDITKHIQNGEDLRHALDAMSLHRYT